MSTQAHWEHVYGEREQHQLSWYEPTPESSLALIDHAGIPCDAPIIDVGGGTSALAARLIDAGYRDLTVLDISAAALDRAKAGLGDAARGVTWLRADVCTYPFTRSYRLWHDRAVFHFMVDPARRERYVAQVRRALDPGGHMILATFGPEGPTRCSGLPVARYGQRELAEMLDGGFALVSAKLEDHRTPTGRSQQFLYSLWRREDARGSPHR